MGTNEGLLFQKINCNACLLTLRIGSLYYFVCYWAVYISKPKFGKNVTISKPKTLDFSSISKPKIVKTLPFPNQKHPIFHPFPNQNSEKRNHFQTETPYFSSISKPEIGKSATFSKPKHTYSCLGFRRARIESSCKANAIKLA